MFQYCWHRGVFQQDNPSSTPVFEAAHPSTLEKQTTAIPKSCTEPLEPSGAEHLDHNPGRKVKNPSGASLETAAEPYKPAKPKWSSLPPSDTATLVLIPYGIPALISYQQLQLYLHVQSETLNILHL